MTITQDSQPTQAGQNSAAGICKFSGVGHAYGPRIALRNVSFSATAGQMIALIGPSGAGKTTLLRIIAGMIEPGSGEVQLYGVHPATAQSQNRSARLVGMMQQRLDLVPQLSARHNAEAGMLGKWGLLRSLAALFLPVSHAPTRAALARVGLTGRESERVGSLSGGEQQRVAMARLLVEDPELILADEPVASLDPALADELLGLLRSIATERGRTVIASVHAPELARRHFDRVIGLREGLVQFDLAAGDLTDTQLSELYERNIDRQESGPAPAPRSRTWGI